MSRSPPSTPISAAAWARNCAASNGGSTALAPLAGKKTWHHVALVIDRTQPGADAVRLYVDYERATPAGRAWDAAARMLDGTLSVGTGFTGRIDDLRVSAGALAPTEFLRDSRRLHHRRPLIRLHP